MIDSFIKNRSNRIDSLRVAQSPELSALRTRERRTRILIGEFHSETREITLSLVYANYRSQFCTRIFDSYSKPHYVTQTIIFI